MFGVAPGGGFGDVEGRITDARPRHHLTADERCLITHLQQHGFANAAIARRVGGLRATGGRELARNRDDFGGDQDESAQRLARERRTATHEQSATSCAPATPWAGASVPISGPG